MCLIDLKLKTIYRFKHFKTFPPFAFQVLSFLEGDSANSVFNSQSGESSTQKNILTSSVPLPDLIDTDYPDGSVTDYSIQKQTFENPSDPMTNDSLVDDLFGSSTVTVTHSTSKDESDPFADVSFHTSEDKEHVDDLFSGLTVDELNTDNEINKVTVNQTSQIMDLFGSESQKFSVTTPYQSTDAHDLFVRLSMDTNSLENKQPGLTFEGSFNNSSNLNEILSGVSNPQIGGVNSNINLPMGGFMPAPYNIPPSMMLNQSFPSQTVGNLFAQQQVQFQNLGNPNAGMSYGLRNAGGGNFSTLPDDFLQSNDTLRNISTTSNSKKEETKAFDFISVRQFPCI